MDTLRTMSITEARKNIFALAEKAQTPGVHFVLTEKGKPRAVLMSAEEFESLVETMEVERIFPDLNKDISEMKKALKTSAWKKWPTLEDIEKKWGIDDVVKNQKKNEIQTSLHKKSRKSAR